MDVPTKKTTTRQQLDYETLEKALAESQQREAAAVERADLLRKVLDNLFVYVGVIHPDGMLIEATSPALREASPDLHAMMTRPFWETYAWSHDPAAQAQVRDACLRAAQGETVRYDATLRLGEDAFTTIDMQMAPIMNGAGNVEYVVATAVDVSDRVHMQSALERAQLHFAEALDHSPVVVFNQDRALRYMWIGHPADGYTEGNVLGRSDADLLPPQYAGPLMAIKRAVLDTGERRRDNVVTLVEGKERTYDLTVAPLRDAAGTIVGVTCAAVDITPQVQLAERVESALAQADNERRRLKAIIDAMAVGVVIADSSGRLVMMSQEADRIWRGLTPLAESIEEYAVYKAWWPATGEPLAPEEWALARALQTGETCLGEEVTIQRFDGTRGTILNSAAPVRDVRGRIVGAVATFMDISERKDLESERDDLLIRERQARQEAEDANALRNRFMGMIAHDLRGPLTSIMGFAETLLALDVEWDAASQREFTQTIYDEAMRMNDLIADLLEFSRVQAGELRIHQQPTPLAAILADAAPQLNTLTHKHRLDVAVAPEVEVVLADGRRIVQELANLVSNAAQHSPEGACITIRASQVDGTARIDVDDEGTGIPPEARETVFEPFRQVEGQPREKHGTGLGLTICKAIVEGHGGRIWVEPWPERGTRVSFTLPRAR